MAASGSQAAAAPPLQASGLRIGDVVQTTFEGQSLESALIDVHEGIGYVEVVSENSSLVLGLPLEAFQLVRRGSSPAKLPDAKARKPKTAVTPVVRRWTDQSGKFSVEGSFAGVADGIVYLKARDGRELKIPLDRLSPADQQLARTPAVSPDGSPFVAMGLDRESPPPAADTPLADTPAPDTGASGMPPTSGTDTAAVTGDSTSDSQLPIPVVLLAPPRKAPGSAKELKPATGEAPFEPDRLAASPQPPRRLRLGAMLRFQRLGVPNRTGTHFAVSSYDMDKARIHVYSLDQPEAYAAVDIGF